MIRLFMLKNGRIVLNATAKEGVTLDKVREVAKTALKDGKATYAQISIDGEIVAELSHKKKGTRQ